MNSEIQWINFSPYARVINWKNTNDWDKSKHAVFIRMKTACFDCHDAKKLHDPYQTKSSIYKLSVEIYDHYRFHRSLSKYNSHH